MNKKILVVDDDTVSLKIIESFLKAKGFEVQTALDGIEGLEKVRQGHPNVVVLDVIMPRLDGYGFVCEMKKDLKLRNIPIVVSTAREMMRDVFVQEGIKDYVVKPYDLEELLKILLKYL